MQQLIIIIEDSKTLLCSSKFASLSGCKAAGPLN
jgi:hypothetical protein